MEKEKIQGVHAAEVAELKAMMAQLLEQTKPQ